MASEMTAAEIAALREIEQRATPGPWEYVENWYDGPLHDVAVQGADKSFCCAYHFDAKEGQNEGDARFIAAIRNAAPALLASAEEAARLRAEVARLDAACVRKDALLSSIAVRSESNNVSQDAREEVGKR